MSAARAVARLAGSAPVGTNPMRSRRSTIEDLRLALDCLPPETKVAMLNGIRTNPIIVGAYTSRDGICPMLAAHRAGGRTSAIAFAHAWDNFAAARSASRRLGSRRATERELRVLVSHLEASLLEQEAPAPELGEAIAQHRSLLALGDARSSDAPRPGDPDRTGELRHQPGWAWLRPVRRYDDYVRSLRAARAQAAERVREPASR